MFIPGFVASPPVRVVADIIIHGVPNKTNPPPSLTTKLEQSPTQLLEGSLVAIEAVTEMIQDTVTVNDDKELDIANIKNHIETKDFLTVHCQESLAKCCDTLSRNSLLKLKKDIQLIYIPKEDIVFGWIERLKGNKLAGIYTGQAPVQGGGIFGQSSADLS